MTLMQRFWAKVDVAGPDACWLWRGATSHGYGQIKVRSYHSQYAHRVSYQELVGPIPEELQIDHLCVTPLCVNPKHLEAVTPRTNTLRSSSFAALNAAKTHCLRGHPFDLFNTYPRKDGRECRTCMSMNWAKENRKRKLRRAETVRIEYVERVTP